MKGRIIAMGAIVLALLSTPSAAIAQAVVDWTDAQREKRASRYAALTPVEVAKRVTSEDDDLEAIATLTTANAFAFKGGFTDRVRADNFLRAHIQKLAGTVSYQLYQRVTYSGAWRRFTTANIETTAGASPQPLTVIKREPTCQHGACIYEEIVAAPIAEALLREVAKRADERPVRPWRFRFKAESGEDWTDDIAPAKVAGLLHAVDEYMSGRQAR